MSTEVEMPRYQSFKQVYALKIAGVEARQDRSAVLAFEERDYAPLQTRAGWFDRFEGSEDDLGYYVVYPDGFTSWSPTEAFEKGYTRIS